jgi:hypothetical protein
MFGEFTVLPFLKGMHSLDSKRKKSRPNIDRLELRLLQLDLIA